MSELNALGETRLETVRGRLKAGYFADPDDLVWAVAEVDRLRGLLRELEWAGDPNQGRDYCPVCPTCRGYRPETDDEPVGHVPGCRLAAELRGG